MNTDQIEREVLIKAPIERVWAALTQPEAISEWFGNGSEVVIDLRPGGVLILDHGDHGRFPTVIVSVTPPTYFSFRWAAAFPGILATEENSTLVEFTLTTTAEGTMLHLSERGFDGLDIPADQAEHAGIENHSKGWTSVVASLAAFVAASGDATVNAS